MRWLYWLIVGGFILTPALTATWRFYGLASDAAQHADRLTRVLWLNAISVYLGLVGFAVLILQTGVALFRRLILKHPPHA